MQAITFAPLLVYTVDILRAVSPKYEPTGQNRFNVFLLLKMQTIPFITKYILVPTVSSLIINSPGKNTSSFAHCRMSLKFLIEIFSKISIVHNKSTFFYNSRFLIFSKSAFLKELLFFMARLTVFSAKFPG